MSSLLLAALLAKNNSLSHREMDMPIALNVLMLMMPRIGGGIKIIARF